MNQQYNAYLRRAHDRHGDKFSECDLAEKFRPYLRQRLEVRFASGEIKRGYVGVTTGWCPLFMLLLRRNSSGSSWLLGADDEILRVFEEWC